MALWVRFEQQGVARFGTLEADGETIRVYEGDMFNGPVPSPEPVSLSAVRLLPPTVPTQFIGLWNNFRELAQKQGQAIPEEPLYFIKAPGSLLEPGGAIRKPASYAGRVIYEGELGIVIGRRLRDASEDEAAAGIFGYTCVNDVTAIDLLNKDPSFAQWTRAKSCDSFGPVGPVVATGLTWSSLTVRTLVNGRERQNYPAADMILAPARIVSLISRELTLSPGDVIACGTSSGALPMRPGTTVAVTIAGIGTLTNTFEAGKP
ncbi:MAG TPA: fumarylacetoacetate hydrolase family protein [Rhodocyclaceae bacterium]|nr:fumarylacetoacetate hydrolase family protein [Rhodocyclaceae bacterium]HUY02244.1 fumarylacetoacetate hydrolase family protein [Rhodocyclaceae bacterium]